MFDLAKKALETCSKTLNITKNNESIIDLLKSQQAPGMLRFESMYLLYCIVSELGVVSAFFLKFNFTFKAS